MKRGCLILLRVCARVRVRGSAWNNKETDSQRERKRERAGKFTLTKLPRLSTCFFCFVLSRLVSSRLVLSCLVSSTMPRRRPETRLWSDVGPCHPAEKVVWVKVKKEFTDDPVTEYVAVKWEQHRRANIAHSLRRAGGRPAHDNAVAVVVNSTAGPATNNDDKNKKVKGRKKHMRVKKERPVNRFRHLLRDAKAIALARMLK